MLHWQGERPGLTGKRIDYVLLGDLRDEDRGSAAWQFVTAELGDEFELVCTSRPRGLAELYRNRAD